MLVPFIGLFVGIAAGILIPGHIPTQFTVYAAMIVLASLDSVVGGIRAKLTSKYDDREFITGFLCSAVFAVLLTLLGKKLGVDLYLALVFVFGARMLQNIAEIRRYLLKNNKNKDTIGSVSTRDEENIHDTQK